jgi:hypothetical protein
VILKSLMRTGSKLLDEIMGMSNLFLLPVLSIAISSQGSLLVKYLKCNVFLLHNEFQSYRHKSS